MKDNLQKALQIFEGKGLDAVSKSIENTNLYQILLTRNADEEQRQEITEEIADEFLEVPHTLRSNQDIYLDVFNHIYQAWQVTLNQSTAEVESNAFVWFGLEQINQCYDGFSYAKGLAETDEDRKIQEQATNIFSIFANGVDVLNIQSLESTPEAVILLIKLTIVIATFEEEVSENLLREFEKLRGYLTKQGSWLTEEHYENLKTELISEVGLEHLRNISNEIWPQIKLVLSLPNRVSPFDLDVILLANHYYGATQLLEVINQLTKTEAGPEDLSDEKFLEKLFTIIGDYFQTLSGKELERSGRLIEAVINVTRAANTELNLIPSSSSTKNFIATCLTKLLPSIAEQELRSKLATAVIYTGEVPFYEIKFLLLKHPELIADSALAKIVISKLRALGSQDELSSDQHTIISEIIALIAPTDRSVLIEVLITKHLVEILASKSEDLVNLLGLLINNESGAPTAAEIDIFTAAALIAVDTTTKAAYSEKGVRNLAALLAGLIELGEISIEIISYLQSAIAARIRSSRWDEYNTRTFFGSTAWVNIVNQVMAQNSTLSPETKLVISEIASKLSNTLEQ